MLLASNVESSRITTFRRSPCQHRDALLVMQQLLNEALTHTSVNNPMKNPLFT